MGVNWGTAGWRWQILSSVSSCGAPPFMWFQGLCHPDASCSWMTPSVALLSAGAAALCIKGFYLRHALIRGSQNIQPQRGVGCQSCALLWGSKCTQLSAPKLISAGSGHQADAQVWLSGRNQGFQVCSAGLAPLVTVPMLPTGLRDSGRRCPGDMAICTGTRTGWELGEIMAVLLLIREGICLQRCRQPRGRQGRT